MQSAVRAKTLLLLISLSVGISAATASTPANPADTIKKIYEATGLTDRSRKLYEWGLNDLKTRNPEMPQDDFAFVEEKLRSFDYCAALAKRWKVAFTPAEWASIDAFVSGVGGKELAAMRAIADDIEGTNRGNDFVRLRLDTFVNSLSSRERDALAEFRQGELADRLKRLLSRSESEVREIVMATFADAVKEASDRRNAILDAQHKATVTAAKKAWAEKGVHDVVDLDVKPWGGSQPRPQLTSELLTRDKRVVVVLHCTITSDGKTADVVVVESSDSRFDSACVAAVSSWTFEPGKKDGTPVACRVRVPLAFERTQ